MKTRGLTVTTLDAKAAADFRTEAEACDVDARHMVPADVYDAAIARSATPSGRPRSRCGRFARRARAENIARDARARRHHAAAAGARSSCGASAAPASPAPAPFTLNLTLWVGLLGAAIAAREGKLLTLATGEFLPKGRITAVAHVVGGFAGAAIAMMFAVGGARRWCTASARPATRSPSACRTWVSDARLSRSRFTLIALRLAWRVVAALVGRADRGARLRRSAFSPRSTSSSSKGARCCPWLLVDPRRRRARARRSSRCSAASR